MGTIVISIVLVIAAGLALAVLIKNKRSGRHPSCGGNCTYCNDCPSKTTDCDRQ
ncbi:MAG: FeoB-associated Cys-rich membrane protein [Treponema sp.]|nr:FeoB-associated Cys-rich membrane protein [Treponema sp.]